MRDPVEDAGAILADYEQWCYRRAHQMTTGDLVDDLAQEGLLAMWRALQTWDAEKGSLPAWLTRKATYRMQQVVTGRERMTGSDDAYRAGAGGSNYVRDRASTAPVDLTAPAGTEPDPLWVEMAFDPERIILAYHRGEIMQALGELSPKQREYVFLRFWLGHARPELVERFGYDPTGLWNSPKNGAKKKLRESLAHLEVFAGAA